MTAAPTVREEDLRAGFALPGFTIPITFEKVVLCPMATWDIFPGHSDPDYARRQGQKDIYLNTVVLQGFADRVATGWAGPAAFIARRRMTMRNSVFPGDVLSGGGTLVSIDRSGRSLSLELAIWLRTQDAPVCDVETTIVLAHP